MKKEEILKIMKKVRKSYLKDFFFDSFQKDRIEIKDEALKDIRFTASDIARESGITTARVFKILRPSVGNRKKRSLVIEDLYKVLNRNTKKGRPLKKD